MARGNRAGCWLAGLLGVGGLLSLVAVYLVGTRLLALGIVSAGQVWEWYTASLLGRGWQRCLYGIPELDSPSPNETFRSYRRGNRERFSLHWNNEPRSSLERATGV